MLLDKIPADMIHIDSGIVGRVDQKTLQDKIEERNKNIVSQQKFYNFILFCVFVTLVISRSYTSVLLFRCLRLCKLCISFSGLSWCTVMQDTTFHRIFVSMFLFSELQI